MLTSIKSLAVLALASTIAQAAVVTYNWNITYVTANPDGLKERRVVGVNGQYPYVFSEPWWDHVLQHSNLSFWFRLTSLCFAFAPTPFGASTAFQPSMSL